jgi:rhodanese/phosphatase family RapZ-like protein
VLDDLERGVFVQAIVTSYGYRRGPIAGVDIDVDARGMSGLRDGDTQQLLARVAEQSDRLLRRYAMDRAVPRGRGLLRIAVGTEDGQLRAAVLAADLGDRLRRAGWGVDIEHRDLADEAP